jgi:hypothetical protein
VVPAYFTLKARCIAPKPTSSTAFPGLLHGTFPADFRLSRAFGLPSELGDFYGLAVRLYGDRHGVADLLFASSFDGAAGKWLPRPHRRTRNKLTLSSLLPYETTNEPGRRMLLGARVTPPVGMRWETMIASDAPPSAISLWAAGLVGRPHTGGYLTSTAPAPRARETRLRFNPWHAPPGLQPAGVINRLRDPAYRGSQRGRNG